MESLFFFSWLWHYYHLLDFKMYGLYSARAKCLMWFVSASQCNGFFLGSRHTLPPNVMKNGPSSFSIIPGHIWSAALSDLQVPGDSPNGCRPQQHRQVSEADWWPRPVPHLPDPQRLKGQWSSQCSTRIQLNAGAWLPADQKAAQSTHLKHSYCTNFSFLTILEK